MIFLFKSGGQTFRSLILYIVLINFNDKSIFYSVNIGHFNNLQENHHHHQYIMLHSSYTHAD